MLIVKKFGGTSVADKERIFNVAKRCIRDYQNGNDVVVVLSAMGKYTDELIAKGQKADYNKILKDIQQRDYQDTHREIAPLKMARDSVKLDTSELDIDGVIAAMKEIIARKVTL